MGKKQPIAEALTAALNELDGEREELWRAALERNGGVVAHASDEFGFSKQRGHFLTKQYGLQEFARDLKSGNRTKKQPRK